MRNAEDAACNSIPLKSSGPGFGAEKRQTAKKTAKNAKKAAKKVEEAAKAK